MLGFLFGRFLVLLDPGAVAWEHVLVQQVSQVLSHQPTNNTYHSSECIEIIRSSPLVVNVFPGQ